MLSASEVLMGAAELIESNGLAKGSFWGDDDTVCTLGAIRHAGRLPHQRNARMQAASWLADYIEGVRLDADVAHSCVGPIPVWNDDPDRTAEDVVVALKAAARTHGRIRKGDQYNGGGGGIPMEVEVRRVAKDLSWADVFVYETTTRTSWTKRQKLFNGALPHVYGEKAN